ncbi:MAG: STAS-like domain-containing protein [Phascolarctobacterium sp.]|nr:STAS-like domain-containing protein [Phascolarctobacterium sp.]
MRNILVKDIAPFALAEEDGILLKNQIKEAIEKNECVCIDFKDINLFATPFFNVSLGSIIVEYGIEKFDSNVLVTNLDELGQETYQHSKENAMLFIEKKINKEIIEEVVLKNIERE